MTMGRIILFLVVLFGIGIALVVAVASSTPPLLLTCGTDDDNDRLASVEKIEFRLPPGCWTRKQLLPEGGKHWFERIEPDARVDVELLLADGSTKVIRSYQPWEELNISRAKITGFRLMNPLAGPTTGRLILKVK